MSYRKIEVDGTTYEYTVGRSHVKVKGVGVVAKEHVGKAGRNPYAHYEKDIFMSNIMVTPGDVAAYIRRQKTS